MKIGLVCPYNMLRSGGVQECVLALRQELSRRGHEAVIVTPQPREHRATPAPPGVIFMGGSTDIKAVFNTTAQISASVDMTALQGVLDSHNFDVLHFHEPWVPILSRQILSRSAAVNVATFHATFPQRAMTRTIERVITPYTRSILKYIDSLTAVSDSAASYVRSLTETPVEIIPNGINLKHYRAATVATHSSMNSLKTILYIGRLEGRKGVKYLVQAYGRLAGEHNDVQLIIAGDGPDRHKLERLVEAWGVPRVNFVGFVSEAEKLRLLQTATTFCSPALYGESFGIVLLEAMACCLPLVAGDNAGYRTLLSGRGQLSLVNPKDAAGFTRQLDMMTYDERLRQLWRAWARQHTPQFSYPRVVDEYEAIYRRALAQHRSNAA